MASEDSSSPIFRDIAIGELVASPLIGVAKANERMARQQVKFLLDTCFSDKGGVYDPVMITMSISRSVVEPNAGEGPIQVERITTDFQVPLITLLPLSSLAVQEAAVQFGVEVSSTFETVDSDSSGPFGTAVATASSGVRRQLAGSVGRVRRRRDEPDTDDAQIAINVEAGTLPLPLGVLTILEAYSKAIFPAESSTEP